MLKILKTWCDEKYGRRAEIARISGASRQQVTDWFSGRRWPTADQAIAIYEFLTSQGLL
jgi:transcriptional regulator with XRE-family HTH domain